jgi:hypothetical protein
MVNDSGSEEASPVDRSVIMVAIPKEKRKGSQSHSSNFLDSSLPVSVRDEISIAVRCAMIPFLFSFGSAARTTPTFSMRLRSKNTAFKTSRDAFKEKIRMSLDVAPVLSAAYTRALVMKAVFFLASKYLRRAVCKR